eukprot:TRINITY_DN2043_c0_g1_i8.p2 TRINITY_DN2043_c0_g1~~TRINITY_DN2043_c0_g1_i8.p2  ORF type:complete len:364 (-),score=50.46 TRINITY_DN2043_c0_g1_i8:1574-2665(-)
MLPTPPLVLAASCCYTEIVTLLLEYGAEPNSTDMLARSALYFAIHKDQAEMAKALAAFGANLEYKDPFTGLDMVNSAKLSMRRCVKQGTLIREKYSTDSTTERKAIRQILIKERESSKLQFENEAQKQFIGNGSIGSGGGGVGNIANSDGQEEPMRSNSFARQLWQSLSRQSRGLQQVQQQQSQIGQRRNSYCFPQQLPVVQISQQKQQQQQQLQPPELYSRIQSQTSQQFQQQQQWQQQQQFARGNALELAPIEGNASLNRPQFDKSAVSEPQYGKKTKLRCDSAKEDVSSSGVQTQPGNDSLNNNVNRSGNSSGSRQNYLNLDAQQQLFTILQQLRADGLTSGEIQKMVAYVLKEIDSEQT